MIDLKTIIQKNSVDPKILQLKICAMYKQTETATEEISPVFSEVTDRFYLLFARDKTMILEETKKQVKDAQHFGHLGSIRMLAESNMSFWWSGERKNIQKKCSTCTACINSGRNSKYQLPSTEKKSNYRF